MASWSKWPMNDDVKWDKDEKTIGVLGLSPVATADFFFRLTSQSKRKDWLYPRIILDCNPKIPSRGRYFALGETDPVPYIRDGIVALHDAGADFVVIPCNTAHTLYDRFAKDISVPVPNIVDITTIAALKNGLRKPLVLSTSTTRDYGLYDESFLCHNIEVTQFPNQELVTQGIEAVKQNLDFSGITDSIIKIIDSIPNIDSVIFGCTEVSVLMSDMIEKGTSKIMCLDSNQALADFCIDYVANGRADSRIRMFA